MKKNLVIIILLLLILIPLGVRAQNTIVSESTYEDIMPLTGESELKDDTYNVPIIGEFDAKTVSLPILSVIMGIVDGFNPCAMWILVFLITMLLGIPDKKKRWFIGLTFIGTSGLVYLLFMISWLNLAIFLTKIRLIRLMISLFAILFGLANIYRFLNEKKKTDVGCDVSTVKQKSKIMAKVKKIVEQKQLLLALLGVIFLAASVNILELLCSLGLPVIFTQVLAINNLSLIEYIIYFGLYILFFLIDDIIVFVIAMKTLSIKGISNKYAKYAHLIGGIIMLILGLLMVLKPEWLMFSF